MSGTIAEFQCETTEMNTGYPIVCVSVRVQFCKRCEIRCIDTGSMRDQIQKAIVSTVAIVDAKVGAK